MLSCSPKPIEKDLVSNLQNLAQTMVKQEIGLDELHKYLPVEIKKLKAVRKMEIGSEKYTEKMQVNEIIGKELSGYAIFRNDSNKSVYRLEITPENAQKKLFNQVIVPKFGKDWKTVYISKTSSVAYGLPSLQQEKVTVFFHLNFPPSSKRSQVQHIIVQKDLLPPANSR